MATDSAEIFYDDGDIEHDAALLVERSLSNLDIWTRDLKISSINEVVANAVRRHTSEQRVLSTLQCAIRAELLPYSNVDIRRTVSSQSDATKLFINLSTSEFLSYLPYTFPIETDDKAVVPSADTSFKQLKRDIERDCFILNGAYMSGSKLGANAILTSMSSFIEDIVQECFNQSTPKMETAAFCECALRSAARTNSGGNTFQILQRCINPTTVMIIPDSKRASPLRIHISIACNVDLKQVGICCTVECSTVFSLCDRVESDKEEIFDQGCRCVEGVYRKNMFYPITYLTSRCSGFITLSESVKFIPFSIFLDK